MMQREEILNAVLAMPPEDRAYIAGALEQSLANDDFSPEFYRELDRRMEAHLRNPETAIPVADVLAELRKRQADETS